MRKRNANKIYRKNNQVHQISQEETLQNLANQSDIPLILYN